MRTISSFFQGVIGKETRSEHVRVRTRIIGGTWYELGDLEGYDWIKSVTIRDEVDAPALSASVDLIRNTGFLSLSPFTQDSKLNNLEGFYQPLIDIGREIEILVGTAAMYEHEPPRYESRFLGYIDEIDTGGGDSLRLRCRDQAGKLLDTFIDTQRVYGDSTSPVPVQDIMQSILTDNLTAVTLFTPVSPGWNLKAYEQQKAPVMEALRVLANQIGWLVKYRYHEGTSSWRLTFYEPERTKTTPDYVFTADDYSMIGSAGIKASLIRNKIRIYYTDSSDVNPDIKKVEVSDLTSISKYGPRFMEITEAAASNIDTQAEAERFRDALLEDVKDPTLNATANLPFVFWPIETGDLYTLGANGEHFDRDQDLAVYGYTLKWSGGSGSTSITLQGKPSGGYRRWFQLEARPGIAPGTDELGAIKKGDITRFTTRRGIGSFHTSLESESVNVVPNRDFGHQSRVIQGSGWAPDSWAVRAGFGLWGPSDDVFVSTSEFLSGGRSLHFLPTATSPTIAETDFFLVQQGELYLGSAYLKTGTRNVADQQTFSIEWYQEDKATLISTANIFSGNIPSSYGWTNLIPAYIIAPAGARFAKFLVTKTTVGVPHDLYIDSIRLKRANTYFWGYPAGGGITIPPGPDIPLDLTTTFFDLSNGLDFVNDLYEVQTPGFYHINAGVSIAAGLATGSKLNIKIQARFFGSFWVTLSHNSGYVFGGLNPTQVQASAIIPAFEPVTESVPSTAFRAVVSHNDPVNSAIVIGSLEQSFLSGYQLSRD